jgi:hypothetical protein
MMTRSVCNINMNEARTYIGAVALVVCLSAMGVDDVYQDLFGLFCHLNFS